MKTLQDGDGDQCVYLRGTANNQSASLHFMKYWVGEKAFEPGQRQRMQTASRNYVLIVWYHDLYEYLKLPLWGQIGVRQSFIQLYPFLRAATCAQWMSSSSCTNKRDYQRCIGPEQFGESFHRHNVLRVFGWCMESLIRCRGFDLPHQRGRHIRAVWRIFLWHGKKIR